MAKHKKATSGSTNKNCKQMTALLHDYLNNTMSRNLKRDFERHLGLCPDCVSFLNTYKKTVGATRSLDPEAFPARVRKNILAFLRKRTRQIGLFLLCAINQVMG
jgi:hypothetical protein